MSISDDHDSLYDGAPSNNIIIPLEYDAISTTTDMFEDCQDDISSNLPQEGTTASSSTLTSTSTSSEQYLNNTSIVPAREKTRPLLAACFGVVVDFSLNSEPYKSLDKTYRPTNNILKREVLRRNPTAKKVRGKKKQKWRQFCVVLILLSLI